MTATLELARSDGEASRAIKEGIFPMNLYVCLPGLFALGLALMGLLIAFIYACDRI